MAIEPETYEMPLDRRIQGGLYPESTVLLEGLIPEQSKGFYIQLANGQHDRAKRLKLEIRFEDRPYVTVVMLNCFKDRLWKKGSPFKPGQRFSIKINVTHTSYRIFTNSRILDEFPHCFPPKDAIFLEMNGDVILENLRLPPSR